MWGGSTSCGSPGVNRLPFLQQQKSLELQSLQTLMEVLVMSYSHNQYSDTRKYWHNILWFILEGAAFIAFVFTMLVVIAHADLLENIMTGGF